MTEEEVRTKECRAPGVHQGTKFGDFIWPACSGSKCAHWKWKVSPKDAAQINAMGNNKQEPQGYCGLTRGE